MNVMQAVAMAFFLTLMLRQIRAGAAERPYAALPAGGRLGLWLALALGGGVWAWMTPFYFIGDDFVHLRDARGPMMKGLWEMMTRGQAGTFLRPAGFASIFVDYRLWHDRPVGYHITNLAIHLAAVAGLFFLCAALGWGREIAGTAAVLFAALPVQVEAVAWMGARFDLLSACFSIWALVCYLKYRANGRVALYLAALGCLILAVFSKENAYVLPLLLAAAEWLVLPERKYRPLVAFFVVAMALFCYRWAVLGGIGGYADTGGRAATLTVSLKTLEGLVVRAPSVTLLGFNWLQPPTVGTAILAALTGALLLALALFSPALPGGSKAMLFCFTWIILPELPAHPLLMLGNAGSTNSRVLYMGTGGAALLLAQLLGGIRPARVKLVATSVLVCLMSLGVLHNLAAWHWTSELSQRFVTEMPRCETSPPPGAEFVFHDLPHDTRGVFFFNVGLSEAVQMAYGREDLSARREEDTARNAKQEVDVKWNGESRDLLSRMK